MLRFFSQLRERKTLYFTEHIFFRSGKVRGQSFSLITVGGAEYSFITTDSKAIAHLIRDFLDGLRKRSRFAIGLQRYTLEGNAL